MTDPELRRRAAAPMPPSEVRGILAALFGEDGQGRAAEALRVGRRTVNRWCSQGIEDRPTILLLRLLYANPDLLRDLAPEPIAAE